MQNHYNLLYREEEREMNRFCNSTGVGLIPVSNSPARPSRFLFLMHRSGRLSAVAISHVLPRPLARPPVLRVRRKLVLRSPDIQKQIARLLSVLRSWLRNMTGR